MRIIRSIKTIQALLRKAKQKNQKVGFVPTMGALHEGHLSLIRKCRKENDIAVISIFVNPAQFGLNEDYKVYPRDKKRDVLLAKKENIDIMFYPSVKDMYPNRYLTYIDVKNLSSVLCGKSRPGHFQGVTTVVSKLLNIVSPDILYLGQKDAQQNTAIKQMMKDLNFPATVKVLPTVRERDGLAMSSRNKYLSPKQRKEAIVLYQSLRLAKQEISRGTRNTEAVTKLIRTTIQQNSSGKIDYVACVDENSLEALKNLKGKVLLSLAVRFGRTRLIDNIVLQIK